ncbi:hypothetical protein ACIQ57_24595 [Lysinibacillus xylanilyticus]|uniref:hypothetical protein n=1 Tax=Lysinibacillus xylanilyticus TaxID=582475 RepID=UPI0037F9B139
MTEFSIVPPDFKEKDPRPFAHLFPDMIRNDDQSFVAFIKKWQRFDFYNSLNMFEEYARANGFILFPATIMHWRRRNGFGAERRARVGRKSFYMVREYELTDREKENLLDYIEEVRRKRL